MQLSFSISVIAFCVALLGRQLASIFYNVFLSPLRKIPGPWLCAISSLPTSFACNVQQRQVHYCHDLHARYGPFVRIAPEEVLISDLVAFQEIHKMGTRFRKTRFYNFLNPTPPGEPPFGLFQECDPVLHGRRRKLFARSFSLHSLRANWERVVRGHIRDLIMRMRKSALHSGGEVDLVQWWPRMAGDIIATLSFGQPLGMIEDERSDHILTAMQDNTTANALAYTFPWAYQVLKHVPIARLQAVFGGNKLLLERGKLAIQNSKQIALNSNIFARVLREADKDDAGAATSDRQIIVDAGTFLFGGTDTTATTLVYLVWSVLHQPEAQKQLEHEVAELSIDFSDEDVEALPILNAIINESLRLYGAAPAALPRRTPDEGAHLGGYFIPGGTTVATQAWTLHRNPDIFPDPQRFDHTRWFGDLASRADVKAAFNPFGAGSRICIGMHLALMEMRLATAMFFREFAGAQLAPSTTPESMEVENVFLIAPKGHACRVILPVLEQ